MRSKKYGVSHLLAYIYLASVGIHLYCASVGDAPVYTVVFGFYYLSLQSNPIDIYIFVH